MRRLKLALFCSVLVIGILSGCVSHQVPRTDHRVSVYSPGIKLDGSLEDWGNIEFTSVSIASGVFDKEGYGQGDWSDANSNNDLSYAFAICHDDAAFYVAVKVTDDILIVDDTKPGQIDATVWKDDGCELFIDGNHNRAINSRDASGSEYQSGGEFAVSYNMAATSECSGFPGSYGNPDLWQCMTNIKLHDESNFGFYIYEFRLSWRLFGRDMAGGDSFGFTIGVMDDDNGGERDHALYWVANSPYCWRDESAWGTIFLESPLGNQQRNLDEF